MKRSLSIRREKEGKEFVYYDRNGRVRNKKTLEHIASLVIPPAWSEVYIAKSPRTKIQVVGYDDAGRQQAIYNARFRAAQDRKKFDRTLDFAKQLPKLRKQVEKDLKRRGLQKEKVLACIVKLIDLAYFRVGNEKYASANHSYGITTLRSKHTEVKGNTVIFDFVGKSGKSHVKEIEDPQIAGIVRRLDELPGYEIFRYQDSKGKMHDLRSDDVNDYIKEHMGPEFSAKDFRTWGGTLIAATQFIAAKTLDSKAERDKFVTEVVANTAERLGNTPAVARSSYIDPRIISTYVAGKAIEDMRDTLKTMKPKKYMSRDETRVMHLLAKTR